MPIETFDGAGERRGPDDTAQFVADLFQEASLQEHRLRARRTPAGIAGTCSNCGERCLPTAVYCDADCRDDHEARERKRARGVGG